MRFRHFPLHPETPDAGLTLQQLFAGRNIDIAAAQERMASLMKQERLPYGKRTHTYNSRLAQEIAAWAESLPGGNRIHDELFKAYFVDGQNLATREVLTSAIRKAGLPEDLGAEVIENRSFQDTVDSDWQLSRQYGITGVPTFVAGNRAVSGAQPYEVIEQLIVAAGAIRRGDPEDRIPE